MICTLEQSQDGNESLYSALSRKSKSRSRNVTFWLQRPEPSLELQNKKGRLVLGLMTVHFKEYKRGSERDLKGYLLTAEGPLTHTKTLFREYKDTIIDTSRRSITQRSVHSHCSHSARFYIHTHTHTIPSADLFTAECRRGTEGCSPQAGPFLPVFAHFIVIEPAAKNRKLQKLTPPHQANTRKIYTPLNVL